MALRRILRDSNAGQTTKSDARKCERPDNVGVAPAKRARLAHAEFSRLRAPGPRSAAASTALVACPVCTAMVPIARINNHLDTECCGEDCAIRGDAPGRRKANSVPLSSAAATETSAVRSQTSTTAPSGAGTSESARVDAVSLDVGAPRGGALGVDCPSATSAVAASAPRAQHRAMLTGADAAPGEGRAAPGEGRGQAVGGAGSAPPSAIARLMASAARSDRGAAAAAAAARGPREAPELLRASRHPGMRCLSWAQPAGLMTLHDFISEDEEAALVRHLDAASPGWCATLSKGRRRHQEFGVPYNSKASDGFVVEEPAGPRRPPGELPAFLSTVTARLRSSLRCLSNFEPNQVTCNEYLRSLGNSLGAHYDDRRLSGEYIVTLSLLSDAGMVFDQESSSSMVVAPMPRRSCHILSGESRYHWRHAVLPDRLEGERRVSITFRRVVVVRK